VLFGNGTISAIAVPEPTALVLALAALPFWLVWRKRSCNRSMNWAAR